MDVDIDIDVGNDTKIEGSKITSNSMHAKTSMYVYNPIDGNNYSALTYNLIQVNSGTPNRTEIKPHQIDLIEANNIGTCLTAQNIKTPSLEVDGAISADDITLNNAITAEQFKVGKWIIESPPDFVFAPDYNLRPLKSVKNFIGKNSHLPEVPSAREIKEEGVDLVKMNMTLLRKVEELYLYTIKQEEKIDKLEKELKELKK
jgi:hypothetical protein